MNISLTYEIFTNIIGVYVGRYLYKTVSFRKCLIYAKLFSSYDWILRQDFQLSIGLNKAWCCSAHFFRGSYGEIQKRLEVPARLHSLLWLVRIWDALPKEISFEVVKVRDSLKLNHFNPSVRKCESCDYQSSIGNVIGSSYCFGCKKLVVVIDFWKILSCSCVNILCSNAADCVCDSLILKCVFYLLTFILK